MFVFRVAPIVFCLVVLLGWPSEGRAQTARPERPYRGLFGSGQAEVRQSLVVNASIGGGYDDNILLDQPGGGSVDPRIAKSGGLGLFNSSLAYVNNQDRSSFGAMAGASTRYYPSQEDPYVAAYAAGVGGSIRYGTRSLFSLNQSASYQPYTFVSLFPVLFAPVPGQFEPGQFEPGPIDLATGKQEYLSLDSNVSLNHAISRRASFNAAYSYNTSETAYTLLDAVDPGALLFTRHGANAGFRYTLSQGVGLRLGYGYTDGTYSGAANRARTNVIDAGIDYNKALSFSRRTTLSFATGTSALTYGGSTSYQIVGNAQLDHEIGRTWNASAAYVRSFSFVDTLLQPVFYDSFNAGLGGLINRRLEFRSGVRAAIGYLGHSGVSGDFDTYQATAGLSFALTRFMQVATNYSFYRYRFDEGAPLPIAVPRSTDRQSIRAQLNFWAPLMTRRR